MIAIVTPSRGLVHSRTVEAVVRNAEQLGGPWAWKLSHDKPIPDAQNYVVDEVLSLDPDYIWMVEEDVAPPSDCLARMVDKLERETSTYVVVVAYRLRGGQSSVVRRGRHALFSGLGCMLSRSSLFARSPNRSGILLYPWFRSDREWLWVGGEFLERKARKEGYGRQDIDFFARLAQHGVSWDVLSGVEADHYMVRGLGRPGTNDGCHDIHPI